MMGIGLGWCAIWGVGGDGVMDGVEVWGGVE